MPRYTVVSGTHRREDGSVATEGDVVEMTEEQRATFGIDQFALVEDSEETVEEPEPEPEPEPEDVSEPEPEPEELPNEPIAEEDLDEWDEDEPDDEPEASGDLPPDYATLRRMAMAYDGDEVHGSSSEADIREFFGEFSDTEVAELKRQATEEEE